MLSILLNGPKSFIGRKLEVLVTDGVDMGDPTRSRTAVKSGGAQLEIVAPHIGGVEANDGSWVEAETQDRRRSVSVVRCGSTLTIAYGSLPPDEILELNGCGFYLRDAFAHQKFVGQPLDAAVRVHSLRKAVGARESRTAALSHGAGRRIAPF